MTTVVQVLEDDGSNMQPLDFERLRDSLAAMVKSDDSINIDKLGYRVVGVGHRITPDDSFYGESVGTSVRDFSSPINSLDLFFEDLRKAETDCEAVYENYPSWPSDVKHVLAIMMFRMGPETLSEFTEMNEALDLRDWDAAATAMESMDWYPKCRRMRTLSRTMRGAGLSVS